MGTQGWSYDHWVGPFYDRGEVTHEARLRDTRPALRFCREARALQLPPDFRPARFDVAARFLHSLPHDIQLAIEFRDRAWLVPETMVILRSTGTALALSTGP